MELMELYYVIELSCFETVDIDLSVDVILEYSFEPDGGLYNCIFHGILLKYHLLLSCLLLSYLLLRCLLVELVKTIGLIGFRQNSGL